MSSDKTIWIDLDNSPHVPFFAPIIELLRDRGYHVVLSARDAYQVYELADRLGFQYSKIGRHYGKRRILKVLGTLIRSMQLLPFAVRHRPDLAVSHGSRAQIIVCNLLRIPSLGIMDYEHARSVAGLSPKWLMVPEVIPDAVLSSERGTVLKYPGIKEDVYAPQFRPDPSIIQDLRLPENDVLVTLRPPATEAHYHTPESEAMFEEAVKYLSEWDNTAVVLLPRNARQAETIRKMWPHLIASRKLVIPNHAVDGLNLIWHSDLVISGGGTMNREAAALGVPVYSIFRGQIGAVDRYLAQQGRLVIVGGVDEVRSKIKLQPRKRDVDRQSNPSTTLKRIVEEIEKLASGNADMAGVAMREEKIASSR